MVRIMYIMLNMHVCIGFNIRVFITPSVSSLFLLNITVIYHKIPNNHIVTVFNYMVIRLCQIRTQHFLNLFTAYWFRNKIIHSGL